MEIIKDIGSYAGFAAVIGLGVLAALYFSQARDLKRLREWAGRAPDREPAPGTATATQRVVATPVPKPGTPAAARPVPGASAARPGVPGPKPGVPGARPGVPGARPVPHPPPVPQPPPVPGSRPVVPARAAAAGATPAVAPGGPAATPDSADPPNGSEAAEEPAPAGDVTQDTQIHPPPEPDSVEQDALEDDQYDEGDELDPPSEEGAAVADPATLDPDSDEFRPEDLWEGDSAGARRPPLPKPAAAVPVRPGTPPSQPRGRQPEPATGESGGILPPYEQIRPGAPARGGGGGMLSSPRRGVLMIGGAILAAIVLGVGVTTLTGGDDSPTPAAENTDPGQEETPPSETPGDNAPGIDPASVTVAVLNGTTVPGLAAQLGDKIEAQGFKLGNVTNNPDQQRAESVVLFSPNAEKEASEVARRMKIAQREPIDPESQALGGDASVVVIAGQNLTQ